MRSRDGPLSLRHSLLMITKLEARCRLRIEIIELGKLRGSAIVQPKGARSLPDADLLHLRCPANPKIYVYLYIYRTVHGVGYNLWLMASGTAFNRKIVDAQRKRPR